MEEDVVFVNHSRNNEFTVITFGYYLPVIMCLTILINGLMLVVLLQREMRTPTNVFITGIALAEMLTGLCPLPVWIYVYGLGNYADFIHFGYCQFIDYAGVILPILMHTVVVWLTLGVIIQRVIIVRFPKKSKILGSTNASVFGVVCVYVLACVMHIFQFYEFSYKPVDIQSLQGETQLVRACLKDENSVLGDDISLEAYFNSFPFLYIFAVQVIPYLCLGLFLVYLIRGENSCNCKTDPIQSKHISVTIVNHTTNRVIFVVTVFIVSHIPNNILLTTLLMDSHYDLDLYKDKAIIRLTYIAYLILMSPLNFVIYCSISRLFQQKISKILHLKELKNLINK